MKRRVEVEADLVGEVRGVAFAMWALIMAIVFRIDIR